MVCMLFSIVAMPGSFLLPQAGADADVSDPASTNKVSAPIYTNPMDAANPGNKQYPQDWDKSSKAQNALASKFVTNGANVYYQYKRSGAEGAAASWATSNPITNYSAAVLKYDVMIDADTPTNGSMYLPAFTNDTKSRTIPVNLKGLTIEGTEYALTPGSWYTFELVLAGSAWTLYINDAKVKEGTASKTITCLNMGIYHTGGNPAEGQSAGANVGFNLDNLAIYSYTPATSMAFTQPSYTVAPGETAKAVWSAKPANAYIPSVAFSSANELIAKVDMDTGVITAVSAGTTTIIATPAPSSGLKPITATVIVADESDIINASRSIVSVPFYTNAMDALNAGNKLYPTDWDKSSKAQNALASKIVTTAGRTYYAMKRSGAEGAAVSWATVTLDTDYSSVVLKYDVMIDPETPANGSMYLPAFTNDSKVRAITLNLKGYTIENTEFALVPGTWYTIELILDGSAWNLFIDGAKIHTGGISKAITCLNMGIANAGGNPAEGQSAGAGVGFNIDNMAVYEYKAATAMNAGKANYDVMVGKTVSTIWTIAPEKAYLPGMTYTSSNEEVAKVDATGIITGITAGTATITATPAASTGLAPATVTVTVHAAGAAVTGVTIKQTDVKVSVGSTTQLTAEVQPANAAIKGVSWISSNPAVAAIDPITGVVTGVSAGTATITVATDDGNKTAKVDVTVENVMASGVTINGGAETATVVTGKSTPLSAAVTPAVAINKTVKWSSSNEAVATVDANTGAVVGVSVGTAVITATVEGTQITDTITILVTAPRSEKCYASLYENAMDAINNDGSGSALYPLGWTRENTTAQDSAIITENGRTYWQMKVGAAGVASSAYTVYTFTDAEGAAAPLTVAPVSVKYSFKVDNDTTGWTTYLPAFATAKRGRIITFTVADNMLTAGSYKMAVESGKWYDIELVLNGTEWVVYVNNGKFASGTLKEAVTSVPYLNAGMYAKSSAGNNAAGVNISIDDLSIHSHADCTYNKYKAVAFEKTFYRFTTAASLTPALLNLPENTSVTYQSSDESVATVSASGKITLNGKLGTAVITAFADGCLLPIATTTVQCSERFTMKQNFENGIDGWRVQISCGNSAYQWVDALEKSFGNVLNNHVLAVHAISQSGNSMRATRAFDGNVELTQASISYDFMLEGDKGVCYLPGFINGTAKMVGQLMVSYGTLMKMTMQNNVGTWVGTGHWITPDTWYHLEQVVDVVAGVYDVYLNGELIIAQQPIQDNCVPFNRVYVGMFKVCTNVQYIDNLVVTEGIDRVTSISFDKDSYSIPVSPNPVQLNVDLGYTGNAFRSIKYVSSDPTVATVNSLGKITGLKNGTVTITAIPYGNPELSATTTVTVTEKPITAINHDNMNLQIGGHQYINPVITPADAGFRDMLYSSSDPKVATADEWGEVVALSKGTTQITITSEKYPTVKKVITVTVSETAYQSTIYVSVNGGGDGSSKESPLTLKQAMDKLAGMDKSKGSIVVEMAAGYYKQTEALNFTAAHGGDNDNFVIFRNAAGAEVTIGGAEILDDEIVSGFQKVDGKNYYVMQLNKDINTRHLMINGIRAVRARSEGGLTNPELISNDGLSYQGFSSDDLFLAEIPEDDHADLEFSYCVEWANHRGGAESIYIGIDGRVQIIMEQPNFQTLVAHSNLSVEELVRPTRPYSMFYENALILLDEPGEWYFDNEEMKLYYMPQVWENVDELVVSYPIIDDWTKDGQQESDSGLINILGTDSGIVQNIKFEGITFADTTYGRTNTNVGMSVSQGMHIRDFNSTSADTMPDAAITLAKANSIYFTGCTFTRLGITGINMFLGTQNVQIRDCDFADISGNGVYIGETNWRNKEVYNPSNPLMVVKNNDLYNCYMHDMGVEYQSASAIAVGYAAYVNLENNEIFNVAYSPIHIGLGWTAEIKNVLRHLTVKDNFIHDFNQGGVWDSGGIYVNGTTSGNLDPFNGEGVGTNLISGNYIRNMGVGTAALYNDGGSDNYIWEYNVVDLSESPLWYNAFTPNGAQWLTVSAGNAPCVVRYNYTATAKTRAQFARASGRPYRIAEAYNEESLNDNNYGLVFIQNTVVEDLNWNAEALALMEKAGLTDGRHDNYPERLITDLPAKNEPLILPDNATFEINLRSTDGKGNPVSLDGLTVAYMSADPSIITVSDTGLIIAVGKGETVLRIYVELDGVVQIIEKAVSVGTNLKDITISAADSTDTIVLATNSEPATLIPYAVTERGMAVQPDSVTYQITDTGVAKFDDKNRLIPVTVGESVLKVTVTAMDKTFTKNFVIRVTEAVNFQLDDLEEIFMRSSISGWKYNKTKINIVQDKDLLLTASGTGYNTFSPFMYKDELFCFDLEITRESLWPSFAIRAQDAWSYVSAGTTGYLFSFTDTGVQLQRFNGSDRTVIYGDVVGFDPVYGGDRPFIPVDGQKYTVQMGALTNGTNVHLFLSVDGEVIFNCVDKGYGAITEPGYFGIICKEGDIFHMTKAQDLSKFEIPDITEGDGVGVEIEPGGNSGTGGTIPTTLPHIPVFSKRPLPTIADKNIEGDSTDGWVLPVVIAATCIVVAGVAVGGVILKKKKKASAKASATEPVETE